MSRISQAGGIVKDEYTSRKYLMAEQTRFANQFKHSFTNLEVKTSPCFSIYPSPKIHQYNRLSLSKLKNTPNIMHLGKVCVCRTISPSLKTLSLMTIVDFPEVDQENEAVFLTLYNCQHHQDEKEEISIPIFNTGTILAVLNPMFYQACDKEIYTVRCDNPADVSVLSQSEFVRLFPRLKWRSGGVMNEDISVFTKSWPHQFGDWMSVGNYWLEKKNYIGAIQSYSLAVELGNDIAALILRCSLYLKLNLYKKSLADSDQILERAPFHEKAICYRASSLIGLSQYERATVFLEYLIGRCGSSADSQQKKELVELLSKAKSWCKQERDGDYDILKMLGCSMLHFHDCADYTGNVTEKDIPGRGRGMIATEDIKCGDLIIGEKAFEIVFHKDEDDIPVCTIDMETVDREFSPQVRLQVAIAHRLNQDPDAVKSFYRLHDGSRKSSVLNSKTPLYKCINMQRIATIFKYNGFSAYIPKEGGYNFVSGIWPLTSLFNHGGFDCNSAWKIFGNFMFVRALKDIMKGEEITTGYTPFTDEYPNRVNALAQYDFVCKCSLCSFDSKESSETHDWRKNKLKELTYNIEAGVPPSTIETLIEEIEEQRSDNPELNVYTIFPKVKLAEICMLEQQYLKASQLLRNVYQCICNTILINTSLACCYRGMICALRCSDLQNATLWAKDMKDSLIRCHGMSSQALLNYLVKPVADLMAEYGIVL